MLKIDENTKAYLEEVRQFARSMGIEHKLQEKLDELDKYGGADNEGNRLPEEEHRFAVYLGRDFAPNSFSVAWVTLRGGVEGDLFMSGGLIYHGPPSPAPEDANLRVQNFSVSLSDDTSPRWQLHT